MRAILQKAGLDVENQIDFCITGKEAYEHVKYAYSNGISYKAIFTDFSMPIMDGIEATAKIRAFLNTEMTIPLGEQPAIIGVTGHVGSKFTVLGEKAGMNQVVAKPVYLQNMVSILENIGMKKMWFTKQIKLIYNIL